MVLLKNRKGLAFLFVAIFLATVFTPIFFPARTYAADTVEVIDKISMKFNGKVFDDENPYDTKYEWLYGPESCRSKIVISNFGSNPRAEIILQENIDGKCFEKEESKGSKLNSVELSSSTANRRFITGYRLDADNIFFPIGFREPECKAFSSPEENGVDSHSDVHRRLSQNNPEYKPNLYYEVEGDGFNEKISLTTSSSSEGHVSAAGCAGNADYDIQYAAVSSVAREVYGITADNKPPDSVRSDETDVDSCESAGAIAWIVCPVILATDGALNWVDEQIQDLLAIDENKYLNDDLKEAWTVIRNVAYIILIPVMLVMVIGTALGVEALSAYTVKKALPRMAIAIVFITLSWYITGFLINFFNVLGSGVLGILTYPFDFNGTNVSTLSLADLFAFSGGSLWSTIIAQGAITIGVAVVIVLFMAPLALTIVTALLILLLRQMFIVALSLLAPLAILAWIFPGNDKLWKFWWGAFSKLLIMFPLIMAVIAVGRIFASILAEPFADGGFDDIITPILVLAAYILPYAMIPFTFKVAGGIFANLTGMLQDGEKGMFGKMREKRAEKISRKTARPKAAISGLRYKGARAAMGWGNQGGKMRGWAGRRAAGIAGGYEFETANSARNAEEMKRIQAEKDTGNDAQVRGATVNLDRVHRLQAAYRTAADSGDEVAKAKAATELEKYAEFDEKGNIQKVKTLSGASVGYNDAVMGHRRFKGNRGAQQAALTYELSKARSGDEVKGAVEDYKELATTQWGMSSDEASWAWKGATFSTQGQHLELKNTSIDGDLDNKAFVDEVYNTKGSYPASQMDSHFMSSLAESYEAALEADDGGVMKGRIEEIIETYKVRGIGGVQGETEEGQPLPSGQGRSEGVSSSGSASFDKELQTLHARIREVNGGNGSRASRATTEPGDKLILPGDKDFHV